MCLSLCAFVYMHIGDGEGQEEDTGFCGAGVPGGGELPNVGYGDSSQVLCKSSQPCPVRNRLSPASGEYILIIFIYSLLV